MKTVKVAVEQGVCILLLEGNVIKAAKFMASNNVPLEVARKALLNPNARKANEWGCSNRASVL